MLKDGYGLGKDGIGLGKEGWEFVDAIEGCYI